MCIVLWPLVTVFQAFLLFQGYLSLSTDFIADNLQIFHTTIKNIFPNPNLAPQFNPSLEQRDASDQSEEEEEEEEEE